MEVRKRTICLAIFCGDIHLHGTPNLGSWNSHWPYELWIIYNNIVRSTINHRIHLVITYFKANEQYCIGYFVGRDGRDMFFFFTPSDLHPVLTHCSDIVSGIPSGSIYGIYSDIFFWHIFRHVFFSDILFGILFGIWHSFRHSFWHSIWHLFWHSFWHSILTFFSDIHSGILSEICFGMFWHSFWHSFNHYIISDTCFDILFGILSGILPGILFDILSGMSLGPGVAHTQGGQGDEQWEISGVCLIAFFLKGFWPIEVNMYKSYPGQRGRESMSEDVFYLDILQNLSFNNMDLKSDLSWIACNIYSIWHAAHPWAPSFKSCWEGWFHTVHFFLWTCVRSQFWMAEFAFWNFPSRRFVGRVYSFFFGLPVTENIVHTRIVAATI